MRTHTRSRGLGVPLSASALLSDVLPNVEFYLDATKSASYPGSGKTWFNLNNAPASGATKSAYDMWLGINASVTGQEPVFSGVPDSPAAGFNMDGTQMFRIKSGNTASFIQLLHRSTSGVQNIAKTYIFAFQAPDATGWRTHSTQTGSGSSNGSFYGANSSEQMNFTQADGTTGVSTNGSSTTAFIPNTPTLGIISINTDGSIRQWVNRRAKVVSSLVFQDTQTGPTGSFSIASNGNGAPGAIITAGSVVYAAAMTMGFIDDADAGRAIDFFNRAHNRVYA